MTDKRWTAEADAMLTTLWKEGLSCSQIAARFGNGMTRNAVIGRAYRMNLPGRTPGHTVEPRPRPEPKTSAKPKAVKGITLPALEAQKPQRPREPAYLPPVLVPPPSGHCTLMQLTSHTCRWPMGDVNGASTEFCGAEPDGTSPYCAYHGAKAFTPASQRLKFKPWSPQQRREAKMNLLSKVSA